MNIYNNSSCLRDDLHKKIVSFISKRYNCLIQQNNYVDFSVAEGRTTIYMVCFNDHFKCGLNIDKFINEIIKKFVNDYGSINDYDYKFCFSVCYEQCEMAIEEQIDSLILNFYKR